MLTWASDFRKRVLIEMCSVVISLTLKELERQRELFMQDHIKYKIINLINTYTFPEWTFTFHQFQEGFFFIKTSRQCSHKIK